jgi:hypothetical protein
MLERGRNLIPVSKGNRGNKKVPHPYLRPRREADAGQVDLQLFVAGQLYLLTFLLVRPERKAHPQNAQSTKNLNQCPGGVVEL